MRSTLKLGAWTAIVMGLVVMYTGDVQAKIMVTQQPMKMAAAEAVYQTKENVPFSIITVGNLDGSEAYWALDIPGLTSFLATGYWDGPESTVQGINDLQAKYEAAFGPGELDLLFGVRRRRGGRNQRKYKSARPNDDRSVPMERTHNYSSPILTRENPPQLTTINKVHRAVSE